MDNAYGTYVSKITKMDMHSENNKYHTPAENYYESVNQTCSFNRKYKDYVYRKMLVQEYLKK